MPKLPQRPLGTTGLHASTLALGTVKWGRNTAVKYPAFQLPDNATLHQLLDTAEAAGINLLDTAPAYGTAQQRLGEILAARPADSPFLIATKTGENFDPATSTSTFDFSAQATRTSIEHSLRLLRRDTLDIVCVHSSPDDLAVVRDTPVLETLATLKAEGKIRATGFSTMTVAGGLEAARHCDVLMLPFNIAYQDHRPVIDLAHQLGRAVLVKRGLFSGGTFGPDDLPRMVHTVLDTPGVTSLVAGTINPSHLSDNIRAATGSQT